jgi:hypothetical protein
MEEIQSPEATLQGMEELQADLASIPSGQYITWSAFDPLAFPPEDLIQQVVEFCTEHGLKLSIAR